MIARLIAYLLLGAVPVVLVGRIVYRSIVVPRLQIRDYRRLGELHQHFTCAAPDCVGQIDPESPDSIFDHRRWWHRRCLRKTIGPGE